ncbi:MAG TPA: ABC transporter substrate-binding protein [Accumulibacter sp.]|uniref:MlaC/ttg2D family ABC transporter substrate-binding protein n=1 Tax=Accumulibacter sp. TaxID=2053492 RepID=UPI0028782080|nr:ABC transporter substrate-binding protein [Accumulibacter sp.]MDS4056915.1 ABC transporter substrate-binding protein [Accumulibacter sp.]HMV04199.1 ABC transporter substrate-binding protein [Accumulibacter sp.]HND38015.1 ABC transporter substrate-binding protein [Accumulibacter sp.]HNE40861.1 ABC transporter substrate-binding protein [Accumulibacter sp.]HNJ49251.1 ABC transporter substrate-binding protein [Accumulibacter sp.]
MKSFCSLLVALFLSLSVALAQDVAPDALVRQVTDDVLNIVRQDKDIQGGNTRKAIDLVESKVLPYFNFQRMTALAVGRDWSKATPEQKKRLADEFKTLLVRTYSNALTSYKNQTVSYKPSKLQAGESDVLIKTEILQPGSKPVQLDYALEKQGNAWKVYDVIVAGVSLVTNYRDTFGQEVRNSGIDGLIQMLVNRNKQLESGKK